MAQLDWGSICDDSDDSDTVVTVLTDPPQAVEYQVKVSENIRLSLTRTSNGGWMQRTISSPEQLPTYEYMLPSLRTHRRQQFVAYRSQRQELKTRYNNACKEANAIQAELLDTIKTHSDPTCSLSFRVKCAKEDTLRRREDAAETVVRHTDIEIEELDRQRLQNKKHGKRLMPIEEPFEWLRNEWPAFSVESATYDDDSVERHEEDCEHVHLPAKHVLSVN